MSKRSRNGNGGAIIDRLCSSALDERRGGRTLSATKHSKAQTDEPWEEKIYFS